MRLPPLNRSQFFYMTPRTRLDFGLITQDQYDRAMDNRANTSIHPK